MKDPFEAAAYEEPPESPPESPIPPEEEEEAAPPPPAPPAADGLDADDFDDDEASIPPPAPPPPPTQRRGAALGGKGKEEDVDAEEEEENVAQVGAKAGVAPDADKMAKMQAILSQFTEEQMSRYESFRRSGFQKSNMRRLLTSITGSQKISMPMTIVVSGIAKMFVGDLVETGKAIMVERKESGPLRPCHIREAYRRLKLEGKVPRRSVPRLFR